MPGRVSSTSGVGSPAALRKTGRRRLVELIRPKAPRMAQRLIDDVFAALDEQTVVAPGPGTLEDPRVEEEREILRQAATHVARERRW